MKKHTQNKRPILILTFSLFLLCFLLISAYILWDTSYNTQNSSAEEYTNNNSTIQPEMTDSETSSDFTTVKDSATDNTSMAEQNSTTDDTSTAEQDSTTYDEIMTDDKFTKESNSDQNNNGQKEEEHSMHPDRVTYCEGFFYEPLTDDIIARIDGTSYHENNTLTYENLNYLNVQYHDFNGQIQTGELICNRLIAQDLMEIFKALYDASYQIEKIRLIDEYQADDDASCADNNTSCFNYRVVAGSDTLSKHALGMAVDINPFYNPYITYPDGQKRISPLGSEIYEDRTGGYEHMILKDDLCYRLFIEHGFTWGGEWKSVKDYQHFEKSVD